MFEVTGAIAELPKRSGVTGSLARRKEETNYLKYLGFNGLIELEKGMRAEVDKRTALTVLYRKNDMLLGLVGGKCRVCGTAQFPKSRICVNPNCKAVDSQDDYGFSEQQGTVLSWSADFLTYSMDPPNHYGMITFAEGGRFMADITDVEQGQVDTGTKVRMASASRTSTKARLRALLLEGRAGLSAREVPWIAYLLLRRKRPTPAPSPPRRRLRRSAPSHRGARGGCAGARRSSR